MLLLSVLLMAVLKSTAQMVVDDRLFYLTYENGPDQSGMLYYLQNWAGSGLLTPVLVSQDTFRDIHIPEFPPQPYSTGNLLASGKHSVWYSLYFASLPTVVLVDSNVNARRGFLDQVQGRRMYLCVDTPYFRIYGNQGLEYSLSETEVPVDFTDALYADQHFYVLYPDELRIINLNQPGQAVAILPTPKPFPFGGVNTWLHLLPDASGQERLHIVIEYYTALMRTSLISLDTSTMGFDSLFHYNTFSNYYKPLVSMDKLYMENFDTHYDPFTQSVHFSSQAGFPQYHPVGRYLIYGDFYLHRADQQEVYMADMPGNQVLKAFLGKDVIKFAHWFSVVGAASSRDQAFPFLVQSLPEHLQIQALNPDLPLHEVCLYNLDGSCLYREEVPKLSSLRIPLNFSPRILILALRNEQGWHYRKQARITP